MNLILIVSSCAALLIYLDADNNPHIKPLKWCFLAFISSFIAYYIVFSLILLVLIVTEYEPNYIVGLAITIFNYATAMLTIKPVSNAMKRAIDRESANQTIKADEITPGDSR